MALSALQIQAIVDATKTPTPEQVRVIEAPRRPLLVVAGAGSGKTETMSMRVLWLLANYPDLSPSSILGLTFTRKAAGELGERLRERIRLLSREMPQLRERLDEDPVSLTYNSFAERIVSEHGMRIGIDPDFSMLSESGALDLMLQIVEAWPTDLDDDLTPLGAVGQILHLAGEIAEHGYTVESAREALVDFGRELEQVGETNDDARRLLRANRRRIAFLDPITEYQKRKRDMGVLDFSDQLVLATRIVREAPAVRESLREEFRAVLLDEFQDTSVIQMDLLSMLFGDHAVTAVGDPNQAIYGWRGASASSLESFLDRFQTGQAQESQTLTLSTAWRNDQAILDAANRVAAPLREVAAYQEGKQRLKAQSPVLVTRDGAGPGHVDVAYAPDYEAALGTVVDFVGSVRSQASQGGKRRTVAVLCRRRKDFAYVDAALRDAGIPTEIVGLGGLLDQPAVQDVRAALELAYDVEASPWLARLLAGIDLGATDLLALGYWSRVLARSDGTNPHQ
ncbi:MAG: ATP-dependent helicase, partial [Actinomyces sp.]|nr:ATP-dependent helicase [Actinomyces sp.]